MRVCQKVADLPHRIYQIPLLRQVHLCPAGCSSVPTTRVPVSGREVAFNSIDPAGFAWVVPVGIGCKAARLTLRDPRLSAPVVC